jgi:DNA-binding Xre family transcriptional regulator
MSEIKWVLDKTIDELDITRNALAVEAKVRPATIQDMVNGVPKRVEFKTLLAILDVLNEMKVKRGIKRDLTIDDIFIYVK